ncbi:MAG TPA: YceI family protein [Vicinamibacterales bacterium]
MRVKTTILAGLLIAGVLVAPAAAQAPAAQPAADPNTWQIDTAHTTAGFSVRHMMVTNVHGTLGKVTGTIKYDGKDLSTLVVDATIDATGINTNEPKRDAHLKSADFFDVANHPTITFKSKRVEKGATPGTFKLLGDLTMRGVTKEVVLDVEGPTEPVNAGRVTKIGATATTTLNRKDFNINYHRTLDSGGLVVADTVKVTLEVEANRPNPAAATSQN